VDAVFYVLENSIMFNKGSRTISSRS